MTHRWLVNVNDPIRVGFAGADGRFRAHCCDPFLVVSGAQPKALAAHGNRRQRLSQAAVQHPAEACAYKAGQGDPGHEPCQNLSNPRDNGYDLAKCILAGSIMPGKVPGRVPQRLAGCCSCFGGLRVRDVGNGRPDRPLQKSMPVRGSRIAAPASPATQRVPQ